MIGPWCHGPFNGKTGDVDFGPESRIEESDDLILRWYDYLLKGIPNGMEKEKPVKIFVMGKNVWRDEDDWPLARAKSTRFYLHSGGKANTSTGDGALNTTAPRPEASDVFTYDPADPVPTRGRPLLRQRTPGFRGIRPASQRATQRCAGIFVADSSGRKWKSRDQSA